MNKKLIITCLLAASVFTVKAAVNGIDTTKVDPPLVFSGSVDTYWKYDFSGMGNIPTSFANEQNSISIGMID
ncbi:MAG: porin, partial [Mucilaginibacter sp.]